MFNSKKSKNHKKSKQYHNYKAFSNSETSLESSLWEYGDDQNERKQVQFNTDYENSSRDIYYGGRQMNVYSYPYLDDTSNLYESENEFHGYDSEDSRYTHYHQSPQQIMYTGTDSAFTIADSDYENNGYGYQSKYNHNYKHDNKKKRYPSKIVRRIGASSFGEDLNIYFARQPPNHHTFQHKKSRHGESSPSDSEVQRDFDADTSEESDYPTDDKQKQSAYQIYVTNQAKNETNRAFKKELSKDGQEMVISVTDYDNIPLLAFKNRNPNVSLQKSSSKVVYLPVLVSGRPMPNEDMFLTSKNKNNNAQLLSSKNIEVAEKPAENIKVYTAMHTEETNVFEKTSGKNHDKSKLSHKTNDKKQQKVSVLKTETTEDNSDNLLKNTKKRSDSRQVSKKSKSSYSNLHSILKLPGVRKSELSLNVASPTSDQHQLKLNKIKDIDSNVSVKSRKSITEVKNKKEKEPSKISKRGTKYEKALVKTIMNGGYKDKNGLSRTESNTSNITKMSSKSSISSSRKIKTLKRNNTDTNLQDHPLIGETPSGSEDGSSYYSDAHQRELQVRKEKVDRKSKIKQGKQNTNTVSKEIKNTELSEYGKLKTDNKNMSSRENFNISPSDTKIDKLDSKFLTNHESENLSTTLKENETKNKRQSVAIISLTKPKQESLSVLETNRNTNKNVLPSVFGANYKQEADVKPKSSGRESNITMKYGDSKTTLTKESKTTRPTNGCSKKSHIENKDSHIISDHVNVEPKQLESDQNKPKHRETKSFVARESVIARDRDTKTLPQKTYGRLEGNNTVNNQKNTEENKIKNQFSDQKKTVQGNTKSEIEETSLKIGETNSNFNQRTNCNNRSLTKRNNIVGETNSDQNHTVQEITKSLTKEQMSAVGNTDLDLSKNVDGSYKSIVKENEISREINTDLNQKVQGSRKSLVKENTTVEESETDFNRKGLGSRKSLVNKSMIVEKTNPDLNTRGQDSRKSVVKGSILARQCSQDQNKKVQGSRKSEEKAPGETNSDQSQLVQVGRNSLVKENTTVGDNKSDYNHKGLGSKKSLVNKSMIVKETNPDLDPKVQDSRKSLVKGSMILAESTQDQNQNVQGSRKSMARKSQLSNTNQAVKDITKPAVKDNKQVRETSSYIQKNIVESQGIEKKENQQQLRESQTDRRQAVEETKSALQKKSQIYEYKSTEKVNEDAKNSEIKKTSGATEEIKSSGRRKSQVFQNQSKDRIDEEIRKSFVKKDVSDTRVKNSSILQLKHALGEQKTKLNETPEDQIGAKSIGIKANTTGVSHSYVGDKGIKDKTTVSIKPTIENRNDKDQEIILEINKYQQKDLNSEQQTIVHERLSSIVNKNDNNKSAPKSRFTVSDQKHELKNWESFEPNTDQKQNSIDQNDQNIATEKNLKKKSTDKISTVGEKSKKSKRSSHKKEAMREKSTSKQSKISKTGSFHFPSVKFWGQDFYTLITYCFQISQFILGVSTYDKFIEVLRNFY